MSVINGENVEVKEKKKRGRKPSKEKKDKYYFGQEEEDAFSKYTELLEASKSDILTNDEKKEINKRKDIIFKEKLYPAFSKMVESIIRTYSLFVPLEEFDETFSDAMSFLVTKIDNFDPKSGKITISYPVKDDRVFVNGEEYFVEEDKIDNFDTKYEVKNNKLYINYPVKDDRVFVNGEEYFVEDGKININGVLYKVDYYKLFSYCGTICKRYLIHRRNQDKKKRDNQLSYDMMFPTADKDTRVDIDDEKLNIKFNNDLIEKTLKEINRMLNDDNISLLNENEQRIGFALQEILNDWEEIFFRIGHKKFNKTSVWFFLKERTLLNSKEIRDGMKRFKNIYFLTKGKLISQ